MYGAGCTERSNHPHLFFFFFNGKNVFFFFLMDRSNKLPVEPDVTNDPVLRSRTIHEASLRMVRRMRTFIT